MMATKAKRPGVKPGQRKRKRNGVPCPRCQHPLSAVKSVNMAGASVVRWRRCLKCERLFRTTEAAGTNTDIAQLNTGLNELLESVRKLQHNPAVSVPIIEGAQ